MSKLFWGKTLKEWKLVPVAEQPERVRKAIANHDDWMQGRADFQAKKIELLESKISVEPEPKVSREERQAEREQAQLDRQEKRLARMRKQAEEFFRECGAVDEEGNYHATPAMIPLLTRKSLMVVNHELEEGSADMAKFVLDRITPMAAPKSVSEMSPEELAVERGRIMSGLSEKARGMLEAELGEARRALPAGGGR